MGKANMAREPYKDPEELRIDTFAMRLNSKERRMLVSLAERLRRTQSDAVRLLIREAVRELAAQQPDTRAPAGRRQRQLPDG